MTGRHPSREIDGVTHNGKPDAGARRLTPWLAALFLVSGAVVLVGGYGPVAGQAPNPTTCISVTGRVDELAWSPDGATLLMAVTGDVAATLQRLDTVTMTTTEIAAGPAGTQPIFDGPFGGGIAIGDDGSMYWAGGTMTTPLILGATPEGIVAPVFDPAKTGETWWPRGLSWTADGIELISVPDPRSPKGATSVTISDGQVVEVRELPLPDASLLSVTPDGVTRLVVGGDGLGDGWDLVVEHGDELYPSRIESFESIATLSGDGSHYLVGGMTGLSAYPSGGVGDATDIIVTEPVTAAAASTTDRIAYAVPFDPLDDPLFTLPPDGFILDPTGPHEVCIVEAPWSDPFGHLRRDDLAGGIYVVAYEICSGARIDWVPDATPGASPLPLVEIVSEDGPRTGQAIVELPAGPGAWSGVEGCDSSYLSLSPVPAPS